MSLPIPIPIVAFLFAHWVSSIFFQTFFLHRYGAHRMFTLSPRWERFFHLMTWVTQGSSFLNPRAYAILHRMHHAYSDTEGDPHSPVMHKNPISMMDATRHIYRGIVYGRYPVERRFLGEYPEWPALDRFAHRWFVAVGWGGAYTLFYAVFATTWWHFLLLPVHYMMGPLHGAIVNWFGHWFGYRNFDRGDASRNTLPFDFVTMGELFQNNHHTYGARANFGVRWFEIDPCWPVIKLFHKLGVLRLRVVEDATKPVPARIPAEPSAAEILASPADAE